MSNRRASRRRSPPRRPDHRLHGGRGRPLGRRRSPGLARPPGDGRRRAHAPARAAPRQAPRAPPRRRSPGSPVRSSQASTVAGCSSPTSACSRPATSARAVRPGWNTASAGLGAVGRTAEVEAGGEELEHALRVVEVVGPAGPVPGGRLGRPDEREPEPPPLARLVAGPGVALADLEHRDVLDAVAQVGAHDVQQAAEQVPAQRSSGPATAGS